MSESEARTRDGGEEQEADAARGPGRGSSLIERRMVGTQFSSNLKNVSTSSRRRALVATIAAPLLPSLLSAATVSPAAASAAELESKARLQIVQLVT
jgi:hypothetical protein